MRRRSKLSKGASKKNFRGGTGTKKINYASHVMRGGIRL